MLTEVIAEFLEKAQRPGLLGLVGKRVQKQCETDLRAYFAALGKRIVEMKFEDLAQADRGISVDHARAAVQMRMHNLLRSRRPLLKAMLHTNLVSAVMATNSIHTLAEAEADMPDPLGMTAEQAAEYAATHIDELITGLDETTLQQIADAVATGITDELGVPGTARLIKDIVDGMSTWRAEMIAATEMNDAMSWAFLQKLVNNGIEYKQWILGPDPCEVCEGNSEQGAIPVDDEFDSGDDAPPAHPNCVCAVAGARPPDTIQ